MIHKSTQYVGILLLSLSYLFFISLPREPLGVIILEGCTVELAEEETEVFFAKLMVVQTVWCLSSTIIKIYGFWSIPDLSGKWNQLKTQYRDLSGLRI